MKEAGMNIDNPLQFRLEVDKANERFSALLDRIRCVSPDIIDRYTTMAAPVKAITDALDASDRTIRLADFLLHKPEASR